MPRIIQELRDGADLVTGSRMHRESKVERSAKREFFDTELMLLAEYSGLKIRSIPIVWIEDLDSRVDIIQYILENLRGLSRVRLRLGSFAKRLKK